MRSIKNVEQLRKALAGGPANAPLGLQQGDGDDARIQPVTVSVTYLWTPAGPRMVLAIDNDNDAPAYRLGDCDRGD